MKNKMKFAKSLPLIAFLFSGCGPSFQTSESSSNLGNEVRDVLTCPNSRSSIFSIYAKAYDEAESRAQSLGFGTLSVDENGAQNEALIADLEQQLRKVHQIFTADLVEIATQQSSRAMSLSEVSEEESDLHKESDPVLHLARLELRSEISPEYASLNETLDSELEKAKELAERAGLECNDENPLSDSPDQGGNGSNPQPPQEQPSQPGSAPIFPPQSSNLKSYHPLYGARWTMATAYQSCASIEIPAISADTPDAKGIRRGAQHSDGVGYNREYTEKTTIKTLIMQTHPYFIGQSYSGSCADQRMKPLVYDYGGTPVIEKSDGALNMFVNRGGGGALGIDCSAFVSTAVAKAGNLYTPGSSNKPYYSRHTSRDFNRASGWKCYDTVQVTGQNFIRPGDILSINGHVVMIDSVGADPFGLQLVSSSSKCSSISYKNFDFVVIQSSPDKGSVGINRFAARDYFAGSAGMRSAITAYAKRACESKFDGKVKTPKTSSFNIIRHKGTSDCLAPQIRLVNESCIQSCRSLK